MIRMASNARYLNTDEGPVILSTGRSKVHRSDFQGSGGGREGFCG